MKTGTLPEEDVAVQADDNAAMQAALILGMESTADAPTSRLPSRSVAPVQKTEPAAQFVPLDDRWHDENGPTPHGRQRKQPEATARATAIAPAKSSPVVKTILPPRQPTIVITPVDDEEYAEEVEENADGPEVRTHTPSSKLLSTTMNLTFLLIAWWFIWPLGARYTIGAINASASFFALFKIDILSWNEQPFVVFQVIGKIGGWIPLIGSVFQSLATLPKIWLFPLIITIGESVFWPRRRRFLKDIFWFWKPLKGEATWKHCVFLFFLTFDIISTCGGAIMDQIMPNAQVFRWAVIIDATRTQVLLGLFLGIFCASFPERVGSFTIRDTIGLWFPPHHWIHRFFRPTGYVQYK